MAGYWIVRSGEVTDTEAQAAYGKAWGPIAERFGARIVAGPSPVSSVEGKAVARAFIVEFDSYEQAVACYQDPSYQAALEYGKKASERDLFILGGG